MGGSLAYGQWQGGDSQAVRWRLVHGAGLREDVREPVSRALDDAAEARELLGEMGTADLGRERLVLVSPGPRSSTGYEVEVVSVVERRGRIDVRVREVTPGVDAEVEPYVTVPFVLIAIPRGNKPVEVAYEGR